ncbi:hypothetical protein MJL33_30020, partial [Salmonella enterica subsp. enterica serovar Kentucky]|nr:hypothetical protein [Salmonella enterica subsp. enterica serovar Kentucky]
MSHYVNHCGWRFHGKKLADARDVILHELILHELIGHLSCAVVNVKSMQANNVNHVC